MALYHCLSMLIHGVISPPEATSYDKLKSFSGYLRNEFNFWKVHRIMNTSGLLQSKRSPNVKLLLFTFYIISQISILNFHLTLLVFQIF